MTLSMYQASIPVLTRQLTVLSNLLTKGEAFAKAKNIEGTVLTSARLAPDMFPLSRQVQIATDMAKGCAARLAEVETPSYEDTETTFEELQARIAKTLSFLNGFTANQIEASEAKEITLKNKAGEWKMNGQDYLLNFVLPNVFFHTTTAYDILRHNGVELGKKDFLGEL